MRLAVLAILGACGVAAQQASSGVGNPVPDDVTAYLVERRAHSQALLDLRNSAEDSMKAGNYAEAERAFRELGDVLGLARVYLVTNRPAEMARLLAAELEVRPRRTDLENSLANNLVKMGRPDLAIAAYMRALERSASPENRGEIYWAIGDLERGAGELASAVAALRKARELAPKSRPIAWSLAAALDASGQKEEAEAQYGPALGIDPNNPAALVKKATELLNGDLDMALMCVQRAQRLVAGDVSVSDLLGQIYLRKALPGQSVEVLRDVVALEPRNAEYRYHLALAYLQTRDREQALAELRIALTCEPSEFVRAQVENLLARNQ